jgi:hypothetical protein
MGARHAIEGAVFDPNMLSVIGLAFDRAWSEIAHHFGETDAQTARSRLAEAVLIAATTTTPSCDVDALKNEGLQILALAYRSRWPLNWC